MQFKKKATEAGVVSGVAPSLCELLNIFNAVKLEKFIACINVLVLTALAFTLK